MQKDKYQKHFTAAEAALTKAHATAIASSTRESWAAVAAAEIALLYQIVMYSDVTYGKLT